MKLLQTQTSETIETVTNKGCHDKWSCHKQKLPWPLRRSQTQAFVTIGIARNKQLRDNCHCHDHKQRLPWQLKFVQTETFVTMKTVTDTDFRDNWNCKKQKISVTTVFAMITNKGFRDNWNCYKQKLPWQWKPSQTQTFVTIEIVRNKQLSWQLRLSWSQTKAFVAIEIVTNKSFRDNENCHRHRLPWQVKL